MNLENLKQKYNIIYFDEIESTQDYAKKIAKQVVEDRTVVIAKNQTKGKGTNGRKWLVENGANITFTLISYPNVNISKLEGFTYKIAKSIKEVIQERYNINLEIKLPNDLLLNNKKICGILIESSTYNETVKEIVIGVGFNVNQTNFPDELKDLATSLKNEEKKDFVIEDILMNILVKINENLDKMNDHMVKK